MSREGKKPTSTGRPSADGIHSTCEEVLIFGAVLLYSFRFFGFGVRV
jgi:hypothetical protein